MAKYHIYDNSEKVITYYIYHNTNHEFKIINMLMHNVRNKKGNKAILNGEEYRSFKSNPR